MIIIIPTIVPTLDFYIKMAVGDITSYIRNLVLPVVSLWDVSTSAVEVNRVLASLDETLGEDKPYRIMTKMIAYADKKQRETYIFDELNLFLVVNILINVLVS